MKPPEDAAMNSEPTLYPPLGVIEDRLFGDAATVDSANDGEIIEVAAEPAAELPAWLQEQIGQLAAQRARPLPAEPAAGQIWSVAYRGEREGRALDGRIPILLDSLAEAGVWQGWLVSGDTDYATRADVILDTRELGLAPAASMVQTWNRVSAAWDPSAPYLGQVDTATLAAIRAVAGEPTLGHPPKGVPGKLAMREAGDDHVVLTGDHLGDAHDPRWAYRRIYYEFAGTMLPGASPDQDYDV
jgi:hypothetical protein